VKRPSRFLILTLSGALLLAGCGRAGPPSAGPWPALSDSAFAVLVSDFSERGRYFDTDNLISNEATYLEVADALSRYGVIGGAYIGVGPDQNFSYIARVNPQVAFIVDIRRDNLLQHLWFKALFTEAATRVEFLALMYGKPVPDSLASWRERSLEDLARYIDTVAVAPNVARAAMVTVQRAVAQDGVELSADDRVTILDIHQRFIVAGLDLRFRSHGRGARSTWLPRRHTRWCVISRWTISSSPSWVTWPASTHCRPLPGTCVNGVPGCRPSIHPMWSSTCSMMGYTRPSRETSTRCRPIPRVSSLGVCSAGAERPLGQSGWVPAAYSRCNGSML